MKVLLDGRPTLGGIHRYTTELCRMLPPGLEEVHFDIFGRQPGFDSHIGPAGTGRPWPFVSAMRGCLEDQLFLPRAARIGMADLFHAPHPFIPLGFQRTSVVTCHDLWLMEGMKTKPWGFKRYYDRWNLKNALCRADHVITLSRFVAKRLQSQWGLQSSRVTCIPPPLAALKPATEKTPPSKHFLLTVGTLEPRKNLERLLIAQTQAFKRTRVPLFLVGRYGWQAKSILMQLGHMDGAARWLGSVQDGTLARLYQEASMVIQYSLDEGFDYTVPEALQFGRPLVLSDIPVHREVARDLGIYVSPFDPKELAATIEEVLSWGASRVKEHGERSPIILERLKNEGRIERYLEVYRKALSFRKDERCLNKLSVGGGN